MKQNSLHPSRRVFLNQVGAATIAAGVIGVEPLIGTGPKTGGAVTAATLFRGLTPGDRLGPYLSQFFYQDCNFGANKDSNRDLLAQLQRLCCVGAPVNARGVSIERDVRGDLVELATDRQISSVRAEIRYEI